MKSTTIDQQRLEEVPNSGTLEMPIPKRRAINFVRALAVARSPEFGGRLMQSHKERQKQIAVEIEKKLREFMELMGNKD